jgi:DNA-binding response OmpR family regulator
MLTKQDYFSIIQSKDIALAKVLIIDDEATVRSHLENIFNKQGHIVRTAADGNTGIKLINNNDFDLIVLDIVMPGKGGIETLMELKNRAKDLKIIIISGKIPDNSDALSILFNHFGASRVLYKPFRSEQLLKAAGELLNN